MHRVSTFILAASLLVQALIALPARGQIDNESKNIRQETVLTGKWESFRIAPGRLARPRCITAFEDILANPLYRSRLPEDAFKYESPLEISPNPNGLQYQSEDYIFLSFEGYELVVSCNVEGTNTFDMRFTLAVEARPFISYKGGDLNSIVRSHLSWIKNRFMFME